MGSRFGVDDWLLHAAGIVGDGRQSADHRAPLVSPPQETRLHEIHRENRRTPYVQGPHHGRRGKAELPEKAFV